MHYYQFNIADYRKDTTHLSPVEHFIYRTMIDWYYLDEKPIPADIGTILRKLGLGNDRSTDVQQVLNDFFSLDGETYVHTRIEADISAYCKIRNQARKAGKASAAARKVNKYDSSEHALNERTTTVQPTINHKPITNNQEPLTNTQKDSKPRKVKNLPGEPVQKSIIEPELQAASKATWHAYGQAYFSRYGTEPVRNAKVSSMIKLFVQRIGMEEAPLVATFYVAHNEKFYVQKSHPVDLMLKDAEGLRTQWATGRSMTGTRAGQIDKSQANFSAVGEAMKILEGEKNAKTA